MLLQLLTVFSTGFGLLYTSLLCYKNISFSYLYAMYSNIKRGNRRQVILICYSWDSYTYPDDRCVVCSLQWTWSLLAFLSFPFQVTLGWWIAAKRTLTGKRILKQHYMKSKGSSWPILLTDTWLKEWARPIYKKCLIRLDIQTTDIQQSNHTPYKM